LGSAESKTAIKSSGSRIVRPLFSTTEKYTLPNCAAQSAQAFNRLDFKNLDQFKRQFDNPEIKKNQSKKSLFPIFFDSSTKA
jgi:hypothetical protein